MKDPDKYNWFDLQEDENILFWEHPSIIPALAGMIFGILLAIGGVYVAYFPFVGYQIGWYGLLVIPIGFGITALEYLRRIFIHYIITDKRIVKKTGFIRVDPKEFDFSDVDSINPVQGSGGVVNAIAEHIFGFGDFEIKTDSGDQIIFDNVASYSEYRQELSKRNSMNSVREVMEKHADTTTGKGKDSEAAD